jgi:hypothetical protein
MNKQNKLLKKFTYIVLVSIFFGACTSNTIIKKPKDLIPKDQMVDLLTEMLIASGGENIKNLNLQRKVNYFPLVFEKYDIDSTRFKESNYYYTSRIDDYDEILGKVDARLKALEKRYKEERKISDSIKRMQRDSLRLNKKVIRERRPDFDLEYEE